MLGRSANKATVVASTRLDEMVAKKFVGVRIPPELIDALEKLAKADDRTVSYMINKILTEYLRARKLIK
jgi:hypothetical protein